MDIDRRTLLVSGAAGAALLTTSTASAAPSVTRVLARNLEVPWGLTFLPNGDALVAERISGRIQRVRRTGGRRLVGRITQVAENAEEGGLLGLALSPRFRRDRWLYAYYSTNSDNRIVRMKYVDGRLGAQQVLLAGIPVSSIHNGGRLAFGPSGALFATTGDASDSGDSQVVGSLAGKILRLTPAGGVPSDNPFGNYVWTLGHRNPQGLAFDSDGRLWAAELGQNTRDEFNRIVKGRNYGWPIVEGGDGDGPFGDPLATWTTEECSPSGVAITKGRAWVGALRGQALWSVRLTGPHAGRKVRYFHEQFGRIRTVQKAPDGSLWITTSNRDGRGLPTPDDDRVLRVVV
ncbi:MAG TPA: PQQ-dependent sugar dehydrogenase [Nocardioidaceae bacterium]|nr:PQQ-dependent sugar dehydrogenase [Nocardioidaceae bacterium]